VGTLPRSTLGLGLLLGCPAFPLRCRDPCPSFGANAVHLWPRGGPGSRGYSVRGLATQPSLDVRDLGRNLGELVLVANYCSLQQIIIGLGRPCHA
jgi:hypothetical protein